MITFRKFHQFPGWWVWFSENWWISGWLSMNIVISELSEFGCNCWSSGFNLKFANFIPTAQQHLSVYRLKKFSQTKSKNEMFHWYDQQQKKWLHESIAIEKFSSRNCDRLNLKFEIVMQLFDFKKKNECSNLLIVGIWFCLSIRSNGRCDYFVIIFNFMWTFSGDVMEAVHEAFVQDALSAAQHLWYEWTGGQVVVRRCHCRSRHHK